MSQTPPTAIETVSELKPCPFCGRSNLVLREDYSEDEPVRAYAWHVFCEDCHCRGRNNFPIGWAETKEDAIVAWNRRSLDTADGVEFVPHFDRTRCATEGCGKVATEYFERGGVGSYHCGDCTAKIKALASLAITEPEREPVAWRVVCDEKPDGIIFARTKDEADRVLRNIGAYVKQGVYTNVRIDPVYIAPSGSALASPPSPAEVTVTDALAVEALQGLILLKDLFDASDRNQADAYYILAKQDGAWGNARSALEALQLGKEG